MGQVATSLSDLNPLSVVKAISHDLSVYVLNSCKSSCDLCGCWRFGLETKETHDDQDESSGMNISWH